MNKWKISISAKFVIETNSVFVVFELKHVINISKYNWIYIYIKKFSFRIYLIAKLWNTLLSSACVYRNVVYSSSSNDILICVWYCVQKISIQFHRLLLIVLAQNVYHRWFYVVHLFRREFFTPLSFCFSYSGSFILYFRFIRCCCFFFFFSSKACHT